MKTRMLAASIVAALALTLSACVPPNQFRRGPNPTEELLAADTGPYAFTSFTVADANTPGFGAATIYHPTTTADGTFGAVAISPGYVSNQSAISWFGPRLSSHGFVVITFDTNDLFEPPAARGAELLAALDYLTTTSSVRSRIDPNRLAVMGHSMGGGGALTAAKDRPSLQAAIPLTPWHSDGSWPEIETPTLIVAGENDEIANSDTFARTFYRGMPADLDKAYIEFEGADHFIANSPNDLVARWTISWLKRFVDNDTRYDPFLCPAPPVGGPWSEIYSTCPY